MATTSLWDRPSTDCPLTLTILSPTWKHRETRFHHFLETASSLQPPPTLKPSLYTYNWSNFCFRGGIVALWRSLLHTHTATVRLKFGFSLFFSHGWWVQLSGGKGVVSVTLSWWVLAATPLAWIMAMKMGMSPRGLPFPPATLTPRESPRPWDTRVEE